MPRGSPDANVSNYAFAGQEIDPGAVYQMLWGFSPVDSLGRVIYLDTFNNGLSGLVPVVSGAGATSPVIFSQPLAGFVFIPPYAVKLPSGTTANSLSSISRTFFLGTNARLGLEAGFVFYDTAPNYFFRIDYRINATKRYTPVVKYSRAASQWVIETPSGDVNVFSQSLPAAGNVYNMQIKFVGDWNAGKYVRLFIGDNLVNVSAYDMPVSGATQDGFVGATFRAVSVGATSTEGYIGYILLTKDEP